MSSFPVSPLHCARLVERAASGAGGTPWTLTTCLPPDRTTPIGKIINEYLTAGASIDDHAIHLLFSANRWELK